MLVLPVEPKIKNVSQHECRVGAIHTALDHRLGERARCSRWERWRHGRAGIPDDAFVAMLFPLLHVECEKLPNPPHLAQGGAVSLHVVDDVGNGLHQVLHTPGSDVEVLVGHQKERRLGVLAVLVS